MTDTLKTIPRPLVRTNQWVIFLSTLLSLLFYLHWVLLIPLIAGLLGLLFKWNPIMKFAAIFLRQKRSEYIAEDWDQQAFNQVIAVICLAGAVLSFQLGWSILGTAFTIMVGLASIIAILGFCIGCFIRFQWKQYQYRRNAAKTK